MTQYTFNQRNIQQAAAGTLFHRTQIPLQKWFWLMFLMSQDKGGISTRRAAKLLRMHYATVWAMMHKMEFLGLLSQVGSLARSYLLVLRMSLASFRSSWSIEYLPVNFVSEKWTTSTCFRLLGFILCIF